MPRNALANIAVDDALPLETIGPRLAPLAQEAAGEGITPSGEEKWEIEDDTSEMHARMMPDDWHPGKPSTYGCPAAGARSGK